MIDAIGTAAQLAAGFVLAGGQSSRMGRDKALLPFAGQPLVVHALAILRDAGLSAAIAGANSAARYSLSAFAPLVDDAEPHLGPLAGISAALDSTPARLAVFLPVDLPFLPSSLLAFLLHRARITGLAVTLPAVNSFTQTFPAVLDRALLPLLKAELDAGRRGCLSAFQAAAKSLSQPIGVVPAEFIAQSGHAAHPSSLPPFRWFLDLDTSADLERAETVVS